MNREQLIEQLHWFADRPGSLILVDKATITDATDHIEELERKAQRDAAVLEGLTSEDTINALAEYRYSVGGTSVRYTDLPECPAKRRFYANAAKDLRDVAAALQHAQSSVEGGDDD